MRIKLVLTLLALASATVAASANAFPFVFSWHEPADGNMPPSVRAGAGGIYGTGAQQDWGIKCSHCHIDSAGMIDLDFVVTPAWDNVGGDPGYAPGLRYTITMNLLGEHLGDATDNRNGVNVVIEDAAGATAGIYYPDSGELADPCSQFWPDPAPAGVTTTVFGDCHGILFGGGAAAMLTSWTFDWVAPPIGTGDVTIFWGVVDGDKNDESSLHDDVKEGVIQLREGS